MKKTLTKKTKGKKQSIPSQQNMLSNIYLQGDLQDPVDLLRQQGVYYITGEIDEDTLWIQQDILHKQLDSYWNKEIKLIINSGGGYSHITWSFVDLLDFVRMDITTLGMGMIASGAAILLAAGTKGKRIISKNAMVLIHAPYEEGHQVGNIHQFKPTFDGLKEEHERNVRFWTSHSVLHEQDVRIKLLGPTDIYITPIQAIEYGIVDAIME